MKKVVILISGRGSNMEAIVAACKAERWPAEIACVIASRPDALGLGIAAKANVATAVVDAKRCANREAFEAELIARLDAHRPDCIVLAGFMRVLSESFVCRYADRMLNVHPSLLPAFAGLDTHRRALSAGVRVHGATVHFVSPVVDAGAIVAQAVVPVEVNDTHDTLSARVLAAEHRLYSRAIGWFLTGQVQLVDGRVRLSDAAASQALMVCT
ncbi:MAG: phosphoribosylglycinamide formyltransferase [Burkholderiaceae bacterium]